MPPFARSALAPVTRGYVHSGVLFLDVTSSCKSPMNTGVQRMVRGIHAVLCRRFEVTPLLWIPKLNSYCRLGPHERRFLETPFARHRQPSASPEHLASPLPWSKHLRFLRHRRSRLAIEAVATAGDFLFVPEIFQDNRVERFRSVRDWFPGRTAAVFHDAIALREPELTSPERTRYFAHYVEALGSFDKVICVSRETESDLRHFWSGFDTPPTHTAVLGWPTDFGKSRPHSRPNHGARRILCVATLERRKNHLRLLEAMESLWAGGLHAELILIGRTTADWGSTVLGTVERLIKRGRPLRWLRHVSDHALHAAYESCSFSVYPSVREGFGLPIHESLWHGRPCVCSANGAIGEAALGGGCWKIDPASVGSIASAIRELLTQESLYLRLCDEARSRTFRSWDDHLRDLTHELGLA